MKNNLFDPTLLLCFEPHGHDVRAGVGLAHGQRSHVLTRQQLDRRGQNLRADRALDLTCAFKAAEPLWPGPSASTSSSVPRCHGAPSG